MKKEVKIGIFVVVVVIATFVVINILRGTDIFGKTITLCGRFDDVESLVASAPVQIRGYAAGRVDRVEYDPEEDNFIVECSVDKKFRIPSDSRMMLYSTSIMGGKGIRIDLGSADDSAADGAVLAVGSDIDLVSSLSSGIAPVMAKLSSLMDSLSYTVSGVNSVLSESNKNNIAKALEHLKRTIASADELANSINGKSDELENLIQNLSNLSDKLSPLASSVQTVVDNAAEISGQLSSSELDKTVRNLSGTVDQINGLVDNLSEPLAKILNDADSLITGIKKDPKKYIKITVF